MERLLEKLQRELKVLKMFRAVKSEYGETLAGGFMDLMPDMNIEYLEGKIDGIQQVIDLIHQLNQK